jgi:4'-phosphopantetheinyl transferase
VHGRSPGACRCGGRPRRLPGPNAAHLWLAEPAAVGGLAEDWLADEERKRAAGFHADRDRQLYVFAHALLRAILARYLAARPESLRFTSTRDGRPELLTRGGPPPLRFSLTHTDGLVACMVTLTQDCGVDAERLDRDADLPLLAAAALAPAEASVWRALSDAQRRAFFFQRWTLKEAYLKGRGLGLAVSPSEIAFVDREGRPVCTLGPTLGEESGRWRFWSFRPTPRHCAAAALRTDGAEGELTLFRVGTGPPTSR